MARKPKPKPRPRRAEPTLRTLLDDRLKAWRGIAISVTAIGSLLLLVWSGIVKVGWDPVLNTSFLEYKTEIARKVAEADETLKREMSSKLEEQGVKIRGEIAEVKLESIQLRRNLRQFQVENLEAQEAQIIWSQMPQLIANLAGLEERLKTIPDDRVLIGRRQEVQNAIKNVENRTESIRARLKALREQL